MSRNAHPIHAPACDYQHVPPLVDPIAVPEREKRLKEIEEKVNCTEEKIQNILEEPDDDIQEVDDLRLILFCL